MATNKAKLNPLLILFGPFLAVAILLPLTFLADRERTKPIGEPEAKKPVTIVADQALKDLAARKVTFTEAYSDTNGRSSLFEKLAQRSIRLSVSTTGTLEEAADTIPGQLQFNQGVYDLPFAEWLVADNVRRALRESTERDPASGTVVTQWETFRDQSSEFKRLLAAQIVREIYVDKQALASNLTKGAITSDTLLGLALLLKRHAAAMEYLHQWRTLSLGMFEKLPDEAALAVMDGLIIDYDARDSDVDRANNKAGRAIRRNSTGENVATGPIGLKSNHPVGIYDIDPSTLEADFYTTFAREPPLPGSIKFRDPPLGDKIAKGRKVLIRYESMPLATHDATMAQLREMEDRLHASIADLDPDLAPILQDLKTWSPEETLERTIQGAR